MFQRGFQIIVCLSLVLQATGRMTKVRTYNFPVDTVWIAAITVAQESFIVEKALKEDGTFRFTTGRTWGHRFSGQIVKVSANRTRVVVEWRMNAQILEKSGTRAADRFFADLTSRLEAAGKR